MVLVHVARRDIHGIADRRQLAVRDLAPLRVAPDHVEDLFLRLAGLVDPTLDDLDAIEVAVYRILQRGDQERRRLAGRRCCKVAAHRHAFRVARHSRRARRRQPS